MRLSTRRRRSAAVARRCHHPLVERLELRVMLAPVGYIELGPSDNVALDQPLVAIELLEDMDPDPAVAEWRSTGPSVFNTFLLDTGANSVLAMATAVDDMVQTGDYDTYGRFLETGIGGAHALDISISYRFDYAGTNGERNTIPDTHILSDATKDFSMFGPWGLVGMPAMATKVTSLDMTGWSGGGTELENLHMKVDFADELPAGDDHRYALTVDNRIWFDPWDSLIYGDVPVWADVPFLTATPTNNGVGASGNFLFDTGAQISVLSKRLGLDIGLDSNGDGKLDYHDDNFVTSETVAGVGGEISVPVFVIDEVHVVVTQMSTGSEVDLVWTDLQWLVLDISTGAGQPALDGVFGSDLLTSGWFYAFFSPGMPDGYFDRVHFDFTDWSLDTGTHEEREGTIYFDLNDGVDEILPYGPGVRIRESDRSTDVIEGLTTDTYTIALGTAPTAQVQITVDADEQLLISSDGGITYASTLTLTFTDKNAQTITVAGVEDGLFEELHTGVITHTVSSADADYNGIYVRDVMAGVRDFRQVVIITSDPGGNNLIDSINAAEGGDDIWYWIRLSEPITGQAWVLIEDAANQVYVTNAADPSWENVWIFDTGDWNVPQRVLLTVVDDQLPEGPHEIELVHSAVDMTSGDIIGQDFLPVYITDNDAGGVIITESGGRTEIAEGGATDTYQIALVTMPTGTVQITVTADAQTQVSMDGGVTYASTLVLTFASMTPQTITVRAVDDDFEESTHIGAIQHAITGTIHDPKYPRILPIADVTATIVDNDLAGLTIAADPEGQNLITSLSVVEGLEARYWIALTSQPKQDVTIYLSSADGQVVAVDDANPANNFLTFTPLDWNEPQAVRAMAPDEAVVEGPHTDYVTHSLFSSDPKYQGTVLLRVDIVDPPPHVVGRNIVYNRSAWDGDNAAANAADDGAIASDKSVLVPGQTATFVNYTSYSRGINGLMLDVRNLPGTPTADDFLFRVGNNSEPYGTDLNSPLDDWPSAPDPVAITVRVGAGLDGADRVTLIWADGAIQKCWLQVTVLATDVTGLTENDVFYVGNAVGESGNSTSDALVNATDEIGARNNPRSPFTPALNNDHYDYNRDRLVNATDQIIARNNRTNPFTVLKLITAPSESGGGEGEWSEKVERSEERGERTEVDDFVPLLNQSLFQPIAVQLDSAFSADPQSRLSSATGGGRPQAGDEVPLLNQSVFQPMAVQLDSAFSADPQSRLSSATISYAPPTTNRSLNRSLEPEAWNLEPAPLAHQNAGETRSDRARRTRKAVEQAVVDEWDAHERALAEFLAEWDQS